MAMPVGPLRPCSWFPCQAQSSDFPQVPQLLGFHWSEIPSHQAPTTLNTDQPPGTRPMFSHNPPPSSLHFRFQNFITPLLARPAARSALPPSIQWPQNLTHLENPQVAPLSFAAPPAATGVNSSNRKGVGGPGALHCHELNDKSQAASPCHPSFAFRDSSGDFDIL